MPRMSRKDIAMFMVKSDHIHKSNNKNFYRFVCFIKYRRKVLNDEVSITFKKKCLLIEEHYKIYFVEIGLNGDCVRACLNPKFFEN